MDISAFDVLMFDYHGTLVDWEVGLLDALRPIFTLHGISCGDEELLEAFFRHEVRLEAGPYRAYESVLAECLCELGEEFGFYPSEGEQQRLAASVHSWPVYDDCREALLALQNRYKLAALATCDDDLFASPTQSLGVKFDWVVTTQQARSYKPALSYFESVLELIDVPRERVLHVASSLFLDHMPAKALGLKTVHIDRSRGPGIHRSMFTAPIQPDLTVPDLGALAAICSWAAIS